MAKRNKEVRDSKGFGVVGILAVLLVIIILAVIFSLFKGSTGGKLKLSNGCQDTDLTLEAVAVSSLKDPITLQAKVIMGKDPVPNEQVVFRTVGKDKNGHTLEDLVGRATTDAQGVATYVNKQGIADQSITYGVGGTLTAVKADFEGNGVTDRTKNPDIPFYCGSNATVNLSSPITIQKVEI